jgi:hypothetical protein
MKGIIMEFSVYHAQVRAIIAEFFSIYDVQASTVIMEFSVYKSQVRAIIT